MTLFKWKTGFNKDTFKFFCKRCKKSFKKRIELYSIGFFGGAWYKMPEKCPKCKSTKIELW